MRIFHQKKILYLINFYKTLLSPLDSADKKYFFILVYLNIFGSIIEFLSLSIIIPVLYFLINDNIFEYKEYLEYLKISNFDKNSIYIAVLSLLVFIYFLKFLLLLLIKKKNWTFIFYIQHKLQKKVFFNFLNNSYSLYSEKNSFTMFKDTLSEVNRYAHGVLAPLNTIILESFLLFTIAIMTAFINFNFFILLLTSSILSIIFYIKIIKTKVLILANSRIKNENYLIKVILEAFQAIKDIKIYNKEKDYLNNFIKTGKEISRVGILQSLYNIFPVIFFEFFSLLVIVVLFIILLLLNKDKNTIFFILSFLAVFSFRALPCFTRIIVALQTLLFNKQSCFNVIQNTNKILLLKKNRDKIKNLNQISFKGLKISYKKRNVLNNISAVFNRGKITGIIGNSGSGKSTIVNYLSGLIASESGRFYINKKINKISNLSGRASVIAKDSYLIDDTIENNIVFKNNDKKINVNKLNQVIKISCLFDLIKSLPFGIKTPIGERGIKFSEGQKQRISIARALYNDNDIIIFDEATSSLDKDTENSFLKSLINLKKNKIIIFISHDIKIVNKISDAVYQIGKNKNLLKLY
jgi:ABC-type multidrug transport system fused ATPase/permease subunit